MDTKCIDLVYTKIASISRKIARLTGHRSHSSCVTSVSSRRSLLKQIQQCADDDARCVQRLFRRIASLNRAQPRRCRRKLRKRLEKKQKKAAVVRAKKSVLKPHEDPFLIPNPHWKAEYTCVGLKNVFNQWLKRQHKIRAYFLAQAMECSPSDTSCLRAFYRKVVVIHKRIERNRDSYTRRISRCDSCAEIKLEFSRWKRREHAKRQQLHQEIAQCPAGDHVCMQKYVDRIKAIQKEIKLRLQRVLNLHKDCVFAKPTSEPTGPQSRTAAASALAPHALVVAAVALLAL